MYQTVFHTSSVTLSILSVDLLLICSHRKCGRRHLGQVASGPCNLQNSEQKYKLNVTNQMHRPYCYNKLATSTIWLGCAKLEAVVLWYVFWHVQNDVQLTETAQLSTWHAFDNFSKPSRQMALLCTTNESLFFWCIFQWQLVKSFIPRWSTWCLTNLPAFWWNTFVSSWHIGPM